jgi:hypothetical protein
LQPPLGVAWLKHKKTSILSNKDFFFFNISA